MSTIRRQSIISTILIYVGFAFGALNTYLFIKNFTPEQYGLTRAFMVMGNFFYGFASFGTLSVIYKFAPYYKDNLEDRENDLLSLCLLIALAGFILTVAGGLIFEPLVVRKFSAKSPLLVQYYYWVFPFTFFLLFFSLLEAYAWSLHKTILPNFLKENGFRIFTTILIILFIAGGLKFSLFIKLFSFIYASGFVVLLIYIIRLKKFRLLFSFSRVTKKFRRKILSLMLFVFSGTAITTMAQSVDSFSIASYVNLSFLAVFDFSSYIISIITVPQRSLISISIPILSQAWKDKDYSVIKRIYVRSSLNLLLVSLFLFLLIWLNYENAIHLFNLNPIYEKGKWVVLILGIKFIIDMGTGVNGQIILTSNYWRFEFLCGLILLCLMIPLNIYLVKNFGITGAAFSTLIAYCIYNIIRLYFLWFKFRMQPFTWKTLVILVQSLGCYGLCWLLFHNSNGVLPMIAVSLSFIIIFAFTAIYLNLTPDISPVWATVKKRLRLNK